MRRSGILLPIFSLPSPYGIGTMGQAARDFVDFLARSGQSCWQLLPVGPTSYGDSPYQSFSSFAGNPYFIDLDDLAAEGLLEPADYQGLNWGGDPADINYGLLYETRYPVLRKACARLLAAPPADYGQFLQDNGWLDNYALFMALKDRYGGQPWLEWPEPLRRRDPEALDAARAELAEDVAFWQAVQYLFYHQWDGLKRLANERGVSIIGDLPIYVPLDSADVWAEPDQFQLDETLTPTEVAGCPPDGFSPDGQLWGNPLFDWERMKGENYRWWMRRIDFQFRIFDTLRIDHFRGLDEYYAIPYGDVNARRGRWRPGPGKDFFRALHETLGDRDIIAEDLGFLTDSVRELLAYSGYPGMKILQFAFYDCDRTNDYLPHNYPKNCVVYAGTHDNDTIQAWLNTLKPDELDYAHRYMRLSPEEGFHWGAMRTAWASPADLAVMQMQDILGLGSESRTNIPSTLGCNWRWRLVPGQLTGELAEKLRRDMTAFCRV